MTTGGNQSLRSARTRMPSPSAPGEPMSRQELAEQVNDEVERATGRPGALDANYIGKLERGVIAWPGAHYRCAMRTVLGAGTDRELGFTPARCQGRTIADRNRDGDGGPGQAAGPISLLDDLVGGHPARTCVHDDHIAQIRACARLLTLMDHGHGGTDVHLVATAHLRRCADLLQVRCPARLRPDLFSAVGWLAHVTGFAAFDAARHDVAYRALRLAAACGEEVSDRQLRAKSLASLSRVAAWQGDIDAALTWAETAGVRADLLTDVERAMLATTRARALARADRVRDTVRCLDAADYHFARVDADDQTPEWMAYYDLAQHLGDTGHALFDIALDHPGYRQEACRRLGAATATHADGYRRSRAMSAAKHATLIAVTGGDIEEAAHHGARAHHDLKGVRSRRTAHLVAELRGALLPHRCDPAAAALCQNIEDWTPHRDDARPVLPRHDRPAGGPARGL
ncbi:MAG: hypothetical protein QG608_3118 [Actinomycetota bacterium]|nr:hypothetical protein [Actinomycetota bacterium]